jgi:hypothetical protein
VQEHLHPVLAQQAPLDTALRDLTAEIDEISAVR